MLSIQEVKNAKAGDKPRKFYDRDGLYLFVTPAGGKYWRGKYRVNGREKTLSLGTLMWSPLLSTSGSIFLSVEAQPRKI
ncbi:MAG: Arm DNA-binding domain-containing protein [Pseudomonadota bacterium]|nr:Arm DNA-binding domain-containing protein [Pseudomonadota bacterium]